MDATELNNAFICAICGLFPYLIQKAAEGHPSLLPIPNTNSLAAYFLL